MTDIEQIESQHIQTHVIPKSVVVFPRSWSMICPFSLGILSNISSVFRLKTKVSYVEFYFARCLIYFHYSNYFLISKTDFYSDDKCQGEIASLIDILSTTFYNTADVFVESSCDKTCASWFLRLSRDYVSCRPYTVIFIQRNKSAIHYIYQLNCIFEIICK